MLTTLTVSSTMKSQPNTFLDPFNHPPSPITHWTIPFHHQILHISRSPTGKYLSNPEHLLRTRSDKVFSAQQRLIDSTTAIKSKPLFPSLSAWMEDKHEKDP